MTASELFAAGKLHEAIAAQTETVRDRPEQGGARLFLVELLCFSGQWSKVDRHLDLLTTQQPEWLAGLAQFRQLLRAAEARQQWFEAGRLPEFLSPPDPRQQHYLRAVVCLREGDLVATREALEAAAEGAPLLRGRCNGEPFEQWRDLDDLGSGALEVLGANGRYYWIFNEQIAALRCQPPRRPRDLLWRSVELETHAEGGLGTVFLPVVYPHREALDEAALLGHTTDWRELGEGLVQGVGQRMFLAGEHDVSIMDLETLQLEAVHGA